MHYSTLCISKPHTDCSTVHYILLDLAPLTPELCFTDSCTKYTVLYNAYFSPKYLLSEQLLVTKQSLTIFDYFNEVLF